MRGSIVNSGVFAEAAERALAWSHYGISLNGTAIAQGRTCADRGIRAQAAPMKSGAAPQGDGAAGVSSLNGMFSGHGCTSTSPLLHVAWR